MIQQAGEMDIPVVQFDGRLWEQDSETIARSEKNPLKSFVNSCVFEGAFMCGEKFYESIRQAVASATANDPYVIGVIQFKANMTMAGRYRFAIKVKPSPVNNAYREALEALYEKGARAVFMSNEVVVNQVYDAIAASGGKYDKLLFCGFDAGSKQVAWLQSDKPPRLVGSCSQNPYRIGVATVETLARIAEGEDVPEEVGVVGCWYTRDNVEEAIAEGAVYRDE